MGNVVNYAASVVRHFKACRVGDRKLDIFLDDVLDRLAGDQNGKASAAMVRIIPLSLLVNPNAWGIAYHTAATAGDGGESLARLKPSPNYLIQSILDACGLAEHGAKIPAEIDKVTSRLRRLAENAREIAAELKFFRDVEEHEAWSDKTKQHHESMQRVAENLPAAADYFDNLAWIAAETPRKMHVTRKVSGDAAKQIRALRRLADCTKPADAKQREATVWLIEVALDIAIPKQLAADALRKPKSGNSTA